jgi:hypothetical protein
MKATKADLERVIKNSLSLLDDRTFEKMCDDGKRAVLEMANLVGFSTCGFAPEKEYFIEIASSSFNIPSSANIRDYTAKLVVTDKNDKVIYEEKISQTYFYET